MEKVIKKSVTIFLPPRKNYPSGSTELYEQGANGVADIMLLNNGVIAIVFGDGVESVFSNMPFIFNH